LGIPVDDVAKAIEPDVSVTTGGQGIYVLIDEKFVALTHGVGNFAENWDCPSLEQMVSDGYLQVSRGSYTGASAFFCRSLLMAAGITNPGFYADDCNLISPFIFEVKFLPVGVVPLEIKGEPCQFGLVHVENEFLVNLIKGFAGQSKLNVVDPSQDYDNPDPVKVSCLKTALSSLLDVHNGIEEKGLFDDAASAKAYGLEAWMQRLLDKFLESKDCYCDIEVASTYHGYIHEYGGMEEKVPYVVFGSMQSYDEDGWTDPRDDDAETVQQARDCLLGEGSSGDWQKLTPQFGG
jgi:hypothetical protein